MDRLDSDQLGRYGEDVFANLCSSAGLFANKSQVDRTGWDFLVEFPSDAADKSLFLDQRPQPPDCKAQIKTNWQGASTIRLRLSAAERLAKIDQPACIIVICLLPDLSIASMFGLHLMDDFLSHVLREIRKCEAKNSRLINRTKIDVNYKNFGEPIDPNGLALKNYIVAINDGDRKNYVVRKRRQVRDLGVSGARFSGEFSIEARNHDEITDVLLGKKSARFVSLERTEVRWGIPLDLPNIGQTGTIKLVPKPRRGSLSLQNEGSKSGISVPVDITVASSGKDGHFTKIRLDNELAEFLITVEGQTARLNCDFGPDRLLTLAQHKKRNILRILMCEEGRLNVRDRQKKSIFTNRYASQAPKQILPLCQELRTLLEQISDIVTSAGGAEDDIRLSIKEIDSQLNTIDYLSELIKSHCGLNLAELQIQAKPGQLPPLDDALDILVVGQIKLGADAILFGAVGIATFEMFDKVVLKVNSVKLRTISLEAVSPDMISVFSRGMESETGISLRLGVSDIRG